MLLSQESGVGFLDTPSLNNFAERMGHQGTGLTEPTTVAMVLYWDHGNTSSSVHTIPLWLPGKLVQCPASGTMHFQSRNVFLSTSLLHFQKKVTLIDKKCSRTTMNEEPGGGAYQVLAVSSQPIALLLPAEFQNRRREKGGHEPKQGTKCELQTAECKQ